MRDDVSEWALYVSSLSDWQAFFTLTFSEADLYYSVSPQKAQFIWRRLVQALNRDLYGNHYTRIVGHSYFGYALAFERSKLGALHMHALVDRPTNWMLISSLWRKMAGIVKILPIYDRTGASRYLSKYVSKGGDINLYLPSDKVREKSPPFFPLWYLEHISS